MTRSPKALVEEFLIEVRSGKHPEFADRYMADKVVANQLVSEVVQVIERSPADYTEHVFEMKKEYGEFDFRIDELLADGDKVYARWTQMGCGIRQVTSCVYRVENGLIVEYWIQIDRLGLQLQRNH